MWPTPLYEKCSALRKPCFAQPGHLFGGDNVEVWSSVDPQAVVNIEGIMECDKWTKRDANDGLDVKCTARPCYYCMLLGDCNFHFEAQ